MTPDQPDEPLQFVDQLKTLRAKISSHPEVVTCDGDQIAAAQFSIRVWRLPRWYYRLRRHVLLAPSLMIVDTALDVRRFATMVRVIDIRSPFLAEGTGIRWYVDKGIMGSVTAMRSRPPHETVIHRLDLARGFQSGSQSDDLRRRLHLERDDVDRLCETYGTAIAVPLVATRARAPLGAVCLDTPVGIELSTRAMSAAEQHLSEAASRITELVQENLSLKDYIQTV